MSDEIEAINELLAIMNEHDLDAIKVKMGDQTYELTKRDPSAAPAPAISAPAAPGPVASGPLAGPNVKKVNAPLVGVFYRSSSPGAEPFVNTGDRVQEGQTICILEAMKLMNEIASDYSGIVTRIIPENGELVSLGEEMFWIE
ncbi:MAG: acetyl-CoA carboxylase biotin carboxyl carrier protein [Vulcanimicrobiaceae bacterium]